jgi:hypothetical protein
MLKLIIGIIAAIVGVKLFLVLLSFVWSVLSFPIGQYCYRLGQKEAADPDLRYYWSEAGVYSGLHHSSICQFTKMGDSYKQGMDIAITGMVIDWIEESPVRRDAFNALSSEQSDIVFDEKVLRLKSGLDL